MVTARSLIDPSPTARRREYHLDTVAEQRSTQRAATIQSPPPPYSPRQVGGAAARDIYHILSIAFSLMEQERLAFGEHIKLLDESIVRRDSIHAEVRGHK